MRKIVTLILGVSFLFIAPWLSLYSLGFRIDWERKKLTKTGILTLKTIPKEAEVFLGSKFVNKTDRIFGSIFIKNLLPKEYKVLVKKEGYKNWEKKLTIEEGKITEVKNIVLFPEKIDYEILHYQVKNFWKDPQTENLIFLKMKNGSWFLENFDLESRKSDPLLTESNVLKGSEILNLYFSENSKKILMEIVRKGKVENLLFNLPTKEILWIKENQQMKPEIFSLGNFIFIKDLDGSFWKGNILGQKSEKMFEKIDSFSIAPNKKKIAVGSDNEIWLIFLEDDLKKSFLSRFSGKISNLAFLNNDYLIFSVSNMIKIAETDFRDGINVYEIGNFPNPKVYFIRKLKKIFVLSDEKILSSSKILP